MLLSARDQVFTVSCIWGFNELLCTLPFTFVCLCLCVLAVILTRDIKTPLRLTTQRNINSSPHSDGFFWSYFVKIVGPSHVHIASGQRFWLLGIIRIQFLEGFRGQISNYQHEECLTSNCPQHWSLWSLLTASLRIFFYVPKFDCSHSLDWEVDNAAGFLMAAIFMGQHLRTWEEHICYCSLL